MARVNLVEFNADPSKTKVYVDGHQLDDILSVSMTQLTGAFPILLLEIDARDIEIKGVGR